MAFIPALFACCAAQAEEDAGCSSTDLRTRITACSALILAGSGAAPDFSVVFNNRGMGFAGTGELDQAISDYDEAIYLNPSFALAYSNRGVAYQAKGNIARAIEDYSKAIALAPELSAAFNNRCYALAESGKPEQALTDCDKALALKGNDARALDSRAYVYFRLGRYDNAIRDSDGALELDPAMPTAYFVRGLSKLKLGDAASGQADLTRAKSLDKDIFETMAKIGAS
jgi:tetratricopeptide (TPR) repeat protein